eukprot:c23025_g1_i1 orf=3-194(-)
MSNQHPATAAVNICFRPFLPQTGIQISILLHLPTSKMKNFCTISWTPTKNHFTILQPASFIYKS